jgi:hypothetical protein
MIVSLETAKEDLPPCDLFPKQGLILQSLLETVTLLGAQYAEDVFTGRNIDVVLAHESNRSLSAINPRRTRLLMVPNGTLRAMLTSSCVSPYR